MTKVLIGVAGTAGLGYEEGLRKCKELKIDALEVEYTYGVRMSIEEAKKVGALAKELGIELTCHAPYYINLASKDSKKIMASKKRILDSCERAHYLGAKYVVFHPGFYGKKTKEEIYEIIKKEIINMQITIKKNNWKVVLAPETTGKKSAFGDIDELLKLRKETKCNLTIDFAHILARDNKIDYDELFKKIKNIGHIHSHFSGVEYTPKGERRHLITPADKIKELLKYIKKYKVDITIINESPDPYGDCLKTKKILDRRVC